MSYAQETQEAGREIFPDLARAFALIGICLVNVGVMAWPMMAGYGPEGTPTEVDRAAFFGVNALFLSKSYTLFSFMFGVGFAYQMQSAQRRGIGFAGRYWRRIFGLLVFGLINVAFLFQGDILVMYAILGSLLFLFRNSSARTLSGWAIGTYILQLVLVAFMAASMAAYSHFDAENYTAEMATMAEDAVRNSEAGLAISPPPSSNGSQTGAASSPLA